MLGLTSSVMAHYMSPQQMQHHRMPLMTSSPFYSTEAFACRHPSPAAEPRLSVTPPPQISSSGTLSMTLNYGIVITISLDGSVHLSYPEFGIAMSVSGDGSLIGLLHPVGKMYHQETSEVQVVCYYPDGNNRIAKISKRGISFTSTCCPLLYLVDSATVKTTAEYFLDINYDFTMDFLKMININAKYMDKLKRIRQTATQYQLRQGGKIWILHGFKIQQERNGDTTVTVNKEETIGPVLQFRPAQLKVCIQTPTLHCTASNGTNPHLYVRKDESRIHFDGKGFQCRSGSHSAGFNEIGEIMVFN